MKKAGWIKIHRTITDWKYFRKDDYFKVWLTMLIEANFDEQMFNGECIQRGQLVFTRRTWIKKFDSMTERRLRTIVKNLEKDGQIKTREVKKKRFTIITIVNFAMYQEQKSDPVSDPVKKPKVTQLSPENGPKTQKPEKPAITEEEQIEMFENDPHLTQPKTKSDPVEKPKVTHKVTLLKEDKKLGEEKEKKRKEILGLSSSKSPKEKLTQNVNTLSEKQQQKKGKMKAKKKIESVDSIKLEESCRFIVNYLNEVTGKNFRSNTKETVKLIKRRFSENYDVNDFIKVIDAKAKDWQNRCFSSGVRADKYLRPNTLFSDKHFDSYLNEALESNKKSQSEQNLEKLKQDALRKEKLEEQKILQKNKAKVERLMNFCDKDTDNVIGQGKFSGEFVDDDIFF